METTNRKVQYWAAFAVALASMTSSVSYSWSTPVIPKFHNNETAIIVNDNEISWIVMATSPGVMLGIIVTQYFSDNFGRRSTLLASAVPYCVGTIFILLATKVWMIYTARFFWGLGAGMMQTVAMIYLAEIASKEIRGSLVVGNRFMFNFGGFMVVAIGSFVSYQALSCMLIVLPITYFIACWWISETPYFLLKEGKVDAARKVLMKLNGYKDEKMLEQKLTDMHRHVKEDMRRSATVKELFTGKRYRKALVIAFGLRLCQLMSGSIPVQQYLGRIMQETEPSISVSTGLILYAALRFIVCMLSSLIVDRVGRRPLLIISFTGGCCSFCIVGICFFTLQALPIKDYATLSGNVIFSSILCYSIFSSIGFDTLIYVIPAEIFPLNVKSIAMTCVNFFGSVVIFFSIRIYHEVQNLTGLYGVFWFYGSLCFLGAVFSYFVVPETRGKSLRDIQMEMQGPLYEEEYETVNLNEEENVETGLLHSNEEQNEKLSSNTKDGT